MKMGKVLLRLETKFLNKILKMDLALMTTRLKLRRMTPRLNEKPEKCGSRVRLKKSKAFQKIDFATQRM